MWRLDKYKRVFSIPKVSTGKKHVGTRSGALYAICDKDCPNSCKNWKVLSTGSSWVKDTTLSVECKGRVNTRYCYSKAYSLYPIIFVS